MTVPGGGSYRIDYDVDGDPVLSVRLQEMFGLQSAPQVADGRARLKDHHAVARHETRGGDTIAGDILGARLP